MQLSVAPVSTNAGTTSLRVSAVCVSWTKWATVTRKVGPKDQQGRVGPPRVLVSESRVS